VIEVSFLGLKGKKASARPFIRHRKTSGFRMTYNLFHFLIAIIHPNRNAAK